VNWTGQPLRRKYRLYLHYHLFYELLICEVLKILRKVLQPLVCLVIAGATAASIGPFGLLFSAMSRFSVTHSDPALTDNYILLADLNMSQSRSPFIQTVLFCGGILPLKDLLR